MKLYKLKLYKTINHTIKHDLNCIKNSPLNFVELNEQIKTV